MADPWPVAAAPLPMAKYEVAIAAAAFPAAQTILRRGEATFLSFEWEAAKADVLHLRLPWLRRIDAARSTAASSSLAAGSPWGG